MALCFSACGDGETKRLPQSWYRHAKHNIVLRISQRSMHSHRTTENCQRLNPQRLIIAPVHQTTSNPVFLSLARPMQEYVVDHPSQHSLLKLEPR